MQEEKKPKGIIRAGFTTEIDQFMRDFDQMRTQFPAARLTEIEKHKKIFAKRDKPMQEAESKLWKEF